MDFIKFPSIGHFRHVIKEVKYHFTFAGMDDNGDPIYDDSVTIPILEFEGTVKLHGTNSAVTIDSNGNFSCQSRNKTITQKEDNLGFANFISSLDPASVFPQPLHDQKITWFGEFCGYGIQQKVGVSKIPKQFFVFGAKLDEEWLDIRGLEFNHPLVHNIYSFETQKIEIDFNNPDFSIPKLEDLVKKVEQECPVAKSFGVSGVGEGWVFRCVHPELKSSKFWFKVKGEEHSNAPRKPLSTHPEKLKSIESFIAKHFHEERFTQGVHFLKEMGKEISEKSTGDFIRWVVKDVVKEEKDEMDFNDITEKEVGKYGSSVSKNWFFKYLSL